MSVDLTSITVIIHSFGIWRLALLSSLERNEVAVTVG